MKHHNLLKGIAVFCLVVALVRSLFGSQSMDIRQTIRDVTSEVPAATFDDFSVCVLKTKYNLMTVEELGDVINGGSYYEYAFADVDHHLYSPSYIDSLRHVGDSNKTVVTRTQKTIPTATSAWEQISNLGTYLNTIGTLIGSIIQTIFEFLLDVFNFGLYAFRITIKVLFGF